MEKTDRQTDRQTDRLVHLQTSPPPHMCTHSISNQSIQSLQAIVVGEAWLEYTVFASYCGG